MMQLSCQTEIMRISVRKTAESYEFGGAGEVTDGESAVGSCGRMPITWPCYVGQAIADGAGWVALEEGNGEEIRAAAGT